MNKRMILSGGMLVFMAAIVAGGTGAFFSDTETSTGNVFTAGSVSVTLDSLTHQYYGDETAIDSDYFTVRDASGEAPSFRFNDLKPGDTGMIEKQMTNGANDAFWCARNTLVDADSPFIDRLKLRVNTGNGLTAGQFYNAPFDEWYTLDATNPTNPGGQGLAVDAGAPVTLDLEYCLGDFVDGVSGAPGSAETSCVVDTSIDWNPLQNQEIEVDVEYYAVQQRNNEGFTCGDLNEPEVDNRPLIGADLDAYVAPTAPTTIVTAGQSIQAAIDAATAGDVIVVEAGTYSPFVVDKGLTIAAATGPDSGTPVTVIPDDATYSQLAEVTADDVTITGFVFDGQDVLSTGARTAGVNVETSAANPDLSNIDVSYNRIVNISSATPSAPGAQTGAYALKLFSENPRSMTNVLLAHNEINGVNNVAGGGYGIQSVGELNNATIEYNTITDINSDGWKIGLAIDAKVTETTTDVDITRNVVETGADVDVQVEKNASAGSVAVNENNLVSMLHGGGGYIATDGVDGTVDAENNWWGDVDASDNFAGSIDFDPEELSAYPTN